MEICTDIFDKQGRKVGEDCIGSLDREQKGAQDRFFQEFQDEMGRDGQRQDSPGGEGGPADENGLAPERSDGSGGNANPHLPDLEIDFDDCEIDAR